MMTPPAPAYRSVLRINGGIAAAAVVIPALVAAWLLLAHRPVLSIAIALAGMAVALWLVLLLPSRRFKALAFAAMEDELHVRRGIWFRSVTIVPYGRVQHIDLSQGPIERHYKVARLTLHTAGTLSSSVPLPGIDIADAERMRDEIRAKIRLDLV